MGSLKDQPTPPAHPGLARALLTHHLNRFAEFLSSAFGFVSTLVLLAIGIAIGALIHFDNFYMLGFNLFLSILAIVLAGIILVAGARSEAALHVKLDYLIRYSKAKNEAIGIEHMDVEKIEERRLAIEEDAKANLEEVIEDQVEEEVKEQLGKRRTQPVG